MRIIFTLTLLITALSLNARSISADEAMSIASDFLNSTSIKLASIDKTDGLKKAPATGMEVIAPYYVFNNVEDEGFVIVAGDDRVQKILGYSDKGNFEESNIPPQLKALMSLWETQVNKVSESALTPHLSWQSSLSTRASEGVQLQTSNWGQGYPYNLQCPVIDGERALTGCVATSMAIAMDYYHWPESTKGKEYTNFANRDQTVDYSSATIDWNAMKDDPKSDSFKDAVSYLNLIAGVAVDTYYTAVESSADLVLLGHKLMENFKYVPECQFIERKRFDDATWNKMITDQLDANQVVIYFGNQGEWTSGHAFVIDGYSSDGFYHINWGWDGSCNGNYNLESLIPDDRDFSFNQGMVMNIIPDKEGRGDAYSRAFLSPTDMYVSDFQSNDGFNFTVSEIKPGEKFSFIAPHVIIPWYNFRGDLALAIMDEKNNIIKKMFKDDGTDIGWCMGGLWSDDGCHFPGVLTTFLEMESTGLEPGQRYQLVCREQGESDWKIVTGNMTRPSHFYDTDLPSIMCQINLHYPKDAPILFQTKTEETNQWLFGDGFAKNLYYAGGDITFDFKCYDKDMNEMEPVYVDDYWDHKHGVAFNLTLKYPYNDIFINYKKYENGRHDEGKDPSTIHTIDGLVYEIVDNAAILIGYDEDDKEILVIPDFINVDGNSYPVTEMENNALANYENLRHVELGANISVVQPYALGLLPNLESIGISSSVDFGRMPANWSDNLNIFYFKNVEAQSSNASDINITYGDCWFEPSYRPGSAYLASLDDYYRVPIPNATAYIPGSGQAGSLGWPEMWEYAIDRNNNYIMVKPLIDGLKIESVLVNGKETNQYGDYYYQAETTNDISVQVNYILHDRQPMTTTYSVDFNSQIESTVLMGVDEILEESDGKPIDVYNLQGVKVVSKASEAEIDALPAGIYIIGDKKVRIK